MSETASDQCLVSRAQAGEINAFNDLVRRYRDRVMKIILGFVSNRADAEDMAQEAFIKAYLGLPRFRGECAFYTWLYRIAVNSAKTALSSRARDAQVFASRDVDVDDGSSPVAADWLNAETPENLVLADEVSSAVNLAIDGLSEDQRTAIFLRELEGFSYSQVALAMACPIGTVRSRVSRARDAIDEQLRSVFDDGLGRSTPVAPMISGLLRENAVVA